MFRIINEGYDIFNIEPVISKDMGPLNVKVVLPEGKNLNISRKRLRVEILFKSDKPLSFTTKMEIVDPNSRVYSIPISGTADNCILSNYTYCQRLFNDIEIVANDNTPITIYEKNAEDGDSHLNLSHNKPSTNKSLSSTNMGHLGYTPIPQD